VLCKSGDKGRQGRGKVVNRREKLGEIGYQIRINEEGEHA
jgi:hypothetical protein